MSVSLYGVAGLWPLGQIACPFPWITSSSLSSSISPLSLGANQSSFCWELGLRTWSEGFWDDTFSMGLPYWRAIRFFFTYPMAFSPRSPFHVPSQFHMFFSKLPTMSSLCCSLTHEFKTIHCSMVYLTRDHTLKKTSCPSPNRHQLPIAPQLGVWFREPLYNPY